MPASIDLPALTSEVLEADLITWDRATVADPSALTWMVAVSATYSRETGGAPPLTDPAWTATDLVNRGTDTAPRWRLLVPVQVPAPGVYGLWGRVAGGTYGSPARWLGSQRFR